MNKPRNSTTHRICPRCGGEGMLTARDSTFDSPDSEYAVPCDHIECMGGWIRFRDEDPLEQLRHYRRTLRDVCIGRQYARVRYEVVRERAMSPARLPPDDRSYYQAVRDADHARNLFRMFGLIRAVGGLV